MPLDSTNSWVSLKIEILWIRELSCKFTNSGVHFVSILVYNERKKILLLLFFVEMSLGNLTILWACCNCGVQGRKSCSTRRQLTSSFSSHTYIELQVTTLDLLLSALMQYCASKRKYSFLEKVFLIRGGQREARIDLC